MRVLLLVPLLLAGAGLMVLALAQDTPPVALAAEQLENGAFEDWDAEGPVGWSPSGTVSSVSSPSLSGFAARVDGSGSLSQFVAAGPGRDYTASVQAAGPSGSAHATLRVTFLDAGLLGVGLPVETTAMMVSGFSGLTVRGTAPAGAAYVGVRLVAAPLAPGSAVVFDNASLDDTAQPEPTPTFTPTPTPTPTSTPTPTPTNTPTPVARGPVSRPSPTATGGANPGPVLPGPSGRVFGEELLLNPGFEFALGGLPLAWEKFGGVLFADPSAGAGESGAAVVVSQTDATKWLHQVVVVTPGAWYRARALARVTSGAAEFSVSILWYPTIDGDGESMDGVESERSASMPAWVAVDTGPVQAPAGARSARVRLMLRAPFPAAVVFDEASMVETLPAAEQEPPAGPSVTPPAEAAPEAPGATVPAGIPLAPPAPRPLPVVPLPPRTGSGLVGGLRCLLCLSEVMPDPSETGRDAPYEWVELYNNGPDAVDAGGWSVGDSVSVDAIAGPAVVGPGEFLVVRSRAASTGGSSTTVADGEVGSGFNNDGDEVRLLNPAGEVVDSLAYGADSGGPAAPGPGRTLARDLESGEWRTKQPPSPGADGPPLAEPSSGQPAAVQAFAPEPAADRTPWIILGVCVTIGVFSAPFAFERLRREVRARRGG